MYCEKCDTEYEPGENCRCHKYRRWMENGQEWRVPYWWITDWWDGPVRGGHNHARRPEPVTEDSICSGCGQRLMHIEAHWHRC